MNIREYTDADLEQVKALHAKGGYDYALPPMEDFFSKTVVEGNGIGVAMLLRMNAEVMIVCDPKWKTPAWRELAIRQLHYIGAVAAKSHGAKEAICFLPPNIGDRFKERLQQDWHWNPCRTDWQCWWRNLDA